MPAASEAYAPIRPHLVRVVAVGVCSVVIVLTGYLIVFSHLRFKVADRISFAAVAAAIVWLCWRHATVVAIPSQEGLVVRNLVRTTSLSWAQIVSVRFSSGRPWASLDLSDGTVLAVMAIQWADGQRGRALAQRLAGLVQAYEPNQQ